MVLVQTAKRTLRALTLTAGVVAAASINVAPGTAYAQHHGGGWRGGGFHGGGWGGGCTAGGWGPHGGWGGGLGLGLALGVGALAYSYPDDGYPIDDYSYTY